MAGGNWKEMFNAAVAEDLELLNFHIKMGIDIDYQHPEYLTSVFIETIRLNKLKSARFLLEKGADMYVQESFGKDTATSIAIANKNYEALALMNEFKKADEQVDIAALEAAELSNKKSINPFLLLLLKIVVALIITVLLFFPISYIACEMTSPTMLINGQEYPTIPMKQTLIALIVSPIFGILATYLIFKKSKH